jgi:hypothetical protein
MGIDKKDLISKLTQAIENPKEPQKLVSHEYHELECDLHKLPILTYYPKDGGPYIASGIAVAKDAQHGVVDTEYVQALSAPGVDSARWEVTAGGLPPGFTLDPESGTIRGTPGQEAPSVSP